MQSGSADSSSGSTVSATATGRSWAERSSTSRRPPNSDGLSSCMVSAGSTSAASRSCTSVSGSSASTPARRSSSARLTRNSSSPTTRVSGATGSDGLGTGPCCHDRPTAGHRSAADPDHRESAPARSAGIAGAGLVADRDQRAGPDRHRDVAVPVGAADRQAQPGQLGQQQRRRVAVVVVQADRDQRHPGMHRAAGTPASEIGAAVMRHLEDVGPQVGAGRQQVVLRLDLGVAGQQDPHPGHRGPQHHRGVVRVGVGVAVAPDRAQHVQPDRPDRERAADHGRLHRQPARGQRGVDQPHAGRPARPAASRAPGRPSAGAAPRAARRHGRGGSG